MYNTLKARTLGGKNFREARTGTPPKAPNTKHSHLTNSQKKESGGRDFRSIKEGTDKRGVFEIPRNTQRPPQ